MEVVRKNTEMAFLIILIQLFIARADTPVPPAPSEAARDDRPQIGEALGDELKLLRQKLQELETDIRLELKKGSVKGAQSLKKVEKSFVKTRRSTLLKLAQELEAA